MQRIEEKRELFLTMPVSDYEPISDDSNITNRLDILIPSLISHISEICDQNEVEMVEKKNGDHLSNLKEDLIKTYETAKESKDTATRKTVEKFVKKLEALAVSLESSNDRNEKITNAFAELVKLTYSDPTCSDICLKTMCGVTGTLLGLLGGALGGALAAGLACSCLGVGYSCCLALCGKGSCCFILETCFVERAPCILCTMSISGIIGGITYAVKGGAKGCKQVPLHVEPNAKLNSVRNSIEKLYKKTEAMLFSRSSERKPEGDQEGIESGRPLSP